MGLYGILFSLICSHLGLLCLSKNAIAKNRTWSWEKFDRNCLINIDSELLKGAVLAVFWLRTSENVISSDGE